MGRVREASVYKNVPQKTYDITESRRDEYRRISQQSRLAKLAAEQGLLQSAHTVNTPKFSPNQLMQQLPSNHLRCLSLFSGGGGLDLGFDRAGYTHQAAYELIPICGETFKQNRPTWHIFAGPEKGDVTQVDWRCYKNKVDVIHGGPPCQPFSVAGQQKGHDDPRNMWGEFNRAINTIQPRAFVAENVLGIRSPKFRGFVQRYIYDELRDYNIQMFEMNAADFGVPQIRRRVIFVGFRDRTYLTRFCIPEATHTWGHLMAAASNGDSYNEYRLELFPRNQAKTMGVRAALGLEDIGFDSLAPTLRSGFTGKRNTTSVLNSTAGQKAWAAMKIWPNGVQSTREKASAFPAKDNHFRLSVQDCGLLQGFPEQWQFAGAVYQKLGQIGNSVAPPVAYQVAKVVADALS
ncbi:MAG: DNA (cytosine-5-)-methyltransferase [Chloroflexota bacterium]